MTVFELLETPKLISRKIKVEVKSCNFHTVALILNIRFFHSRALRKQLTAVEKYALGQIEELNRFWRDSQLAAADAEIENQKKEFDARKLEEMTEAIGGASATPTEDGSTASETDSDDSSDDDDDDGKAQCHRVTVS